MGMKSVGIIGAGPAGLVAAKTFLQKGDYSVTIFEAADRVGGMWRALPGEAGDKCSPDMRTNLSRFTVAFSDMSWSSVDLPKANGAVNPEKLPMFPKAWQVGEYLRAYAKAFGVETNIKFNTQVTKAKLLDESKTWEITYKDCMTQDFSLQRFDFLVIACGFFGKPLKKDSTELPSPRSNLQHSSRFRDINSLPAGKIAVIGGGISGSEAAAQAAFQVSAAKYAPGGPTDGHAESKIYHIFNRPFYVMPRYLPSNPHNPAIQDFNLAPEFLPLDLILYNLTRRGAGEIHAALTTVPLEKAKKGHEFIRSVIGGDQRDLGHPELVYGPDNLQYPAYAGISDTYSEFVRSGIIVPVQGWVDDIQQHPEDGTLALKVSSKAPWSRVATAEDPAKTINAAAVIDATGYETTLDFLDADVKARLGFDPSYPRLPLVLTRASVFANNIPNLGFVGFYEGPYWSVMELQARLIAEQWTEGQGTLNATKAKSLFSTDDAGFMRLAMKEIPLRVPQFWMADYIGLVEELSRATDTIRADSLFHGQNGPSFPSRYQSAPISSDAEEVMQDVIDTVKASHKVAKFVAAAVFRGMQGAWEVSRKIDSHNVSSPGGTFAGTAHFHPRRPTDNAYAAEYLYIEEGTFKIDNGLTFPASRRYVYRYNEVTDVITAWFTEEDGLAVGALFNTWQFHTPEDEYHGWMAKGYHWCDPDTYTNTCEFRFRGAAIQSFGITYQVEGPSKDYSHESWYERQNPRYR